MEPRQAAGLILMYHRIGVLECDPWGLTVSPERFAEHLELLRKFGQPRPLTHTADAVAPQQIIRANPGSYLRRRLCRQPP
jgi:hypothetical protein